MQIQSFPFWKQLQQAIRNIKKVLLSAAIISVDYRVNSALATHFFVKDT